MLSEKDVSMKSCEKRELVVKEVVKPLMKKAGFKCKRTEWWKELEDGFLFVHMKNSQFSGATTGICFSFQFSASYKDELRDKVEKQWLYNQMSCIEEELFLPYCGYLAPNRTTSGYRIDGYKNYLPTDVSVEEIMTQIQEDFKIYIMPEIEAVKNVDDFKLLMTNKKKRFHEKEIRILRFYSAMHQICCTDSNLELAMRSFDQFELTNEDIRSHYEWLSVIARNSSLPHLDARPFIEKVLLEK